VIKKRRKRGQKKRTEGWKLVGGTFVNVAPLTSAETRRKKGERERERERERKGEKKRDGLSSELLKNTHVDAKRARVKSNAARKSYSDH